MQILSITFKGQRVLAYTDEGTYQWALTTSRSQASQASMLFNNHLLAGKAIDLDNGRWTKIDNTPATEDILGTKKLRPDNGLRGS